MKRFPMTEKGAQKLREELIRLKSVERPRIIEAIAEARAHGDLKENAEYHAAKEQQSFLEGRISEVENKLSQAEIIDVTQLAQNGRVVFGTTVILVNVNTDEEVTYKIVGDDEADLKHNMISINSPIARAAIAKEVGDVVIVQAPSGEIEYEVVDVKYIP
ncbi:transcription elongation factor GreA [Candidatus Berkiella cookevillensis]|uniref:Transcription elongation factor GreA n=1 Tax=Candidatus Berkiella cookevillensis TaxID=437022 RepID=A0A0Q9YRK2_9GAMM|nr:transcription elongation factor GreA [Candidatus Berkiella cookevillensis]MCS5707827.1 transcription elongation factor GreA [Candidatus Berkiella cookevillensis]